MGKLSAKKNILGVFVTVTVCTTIIALVLCLAQHYTVDLPHGTQYGMVFDAGSSHTSLFIYKWPGGKENNTGIVSQVKVCEVDGGGISSYKQDPPAAAQSLRQCLDVAKATIPVEQQQSCPVYLGATAGMRLLRLQDENATNDIMEEVTKTINGYPFNFRGAQILSGMAEGAYGWVTINYILEGFIKHTFEGKWVPPKAGRILGALDLGGGSTQIAFTPKDPVKQPDSEAALQLYGHRYGVYTHSYLCFGKDQAMKQLQAYLVEMSGSSAIVMHPCYHTGFNLTLTLGDLYDSPCVSKPGNIDPEKSVTFSGTSDPDQCLNLIRFVVNITECPHSPDCGFNGVYQPPVHGEFFAYSAYYYTFDFLGLAPQAPLPKVTSTIETFCKKSWNSLLAEYPDTKEKYLREYCASAQYIMTILVQGYKFNETWDKIYFQKKVADTDIGWTLGYMLNLTNLIAPRHPLVVTGVQRSQWAAEVFFIVFALFLSLVLLIFLFVWQPEH
ncbi:ectonucleoside triphosphate diphosphohydrolase 8 [Clupea harengus]|uniref:Ectonucleoside triphosphate diphosphohydrolase 8 n=1 Tax=Clupea harengus TaxID=7950 RepID=A0A6P3VFV2_CLUHA|nr:ectonucleoside triphosphate diphosphohydrolase 8 [Clupea harengus]XP_031424175.1 ectonucleoside triphosphate diphosphohydrolase 8 [Clupea harengus]XP_031424176.1 ectonucleoside triphosphate diphosphohydrolase 8 [Clupea harengus]